MAAPPGGSGAPAWEIAGGAISLDRPRVMGILNITPDSFSDGGRHFTAERALGRALEMVDEGVDIIDVGGESTRPGAGVVQVGEEIGRVLPVIEKLAGRIPVPISIDTMKGEVAERAVAAGASIINDVTGGADPRMRSVAARTRAGFVVMHMRGDPRTMRHLSEYSNVVEEVAAELEQRIERLVAAGCARSCLVADPGIGFAKTGRDSMRLIRDARRLESLGLPLLLGPSRKAFLGEAGGGRRPEERLAGTLAACVLGLAHGVRIFRVHDVGDARKALDTAHSILAAGEIQQGVEAV